MSTRLFQTIIHQTKDVVNRAIGVIDENGIIIASSELSKIGESRQKIKEELSLASDFLVYEGYTYRYMTTGTKTDCIAFVEGTDINAQKIAELLAITFSNIKHLYDEKYDKGSFVKNIILDNILPSDIYIKSNELHFSNDEPRAVIVVKFQGNPAVPPYEIIDSLVEDKSRDYVISISEQDIVLVKEVPENYELSEAEELAESIAQTLNTD